MINSNVTFVVDDNRLNGLKKAEYVLELLSDILKNPDKKYTSKINIEKYLVDIGIENRDVYGREDLESIIGKIEYLINR